MVLLHAKIMDLFDVAVVGEVDVVAATAGHADIAAPLVPPLPAHATRRLCRHLHARSA